MTPVSDKILEWLQSVLNDDTPADSLDKIPRAMGHLIGGTLAGPAGSMIGWLLGVMASTLLNDVRATVVGSWGEGAVDKLIDGINKRPLPPEAKAINHDLQRACRDALREAICDLGGAGCFPKQWTTSRRQVPESLIYRPPNAEKDAIYNFLQHLYAEVDEILPLEAPPASLHDVQFYLKMEADATVDFRAAFWQEVIYPAIVKMGNQSEIKIFGPQKEKQDSRSNTSSKPTISNHNRAYESNTRVKWISGKWPAVYAFIRHGKQLLYYICRFVTFGRYPLAETKRSGNKSEHGDYTPLGKAANSNDEIVASRFAVLLRDQQQFQLHLARHLVPRMLVHLGENIKEDTHSWRAFSRLVFREILEQLADLQSTNQQVLHELQRIQQQLDEKLGQFDLTALGALVQQLGDTEQQTTVTDLHKRLDEITELLKRLLAEHGKGRTLRKPPAPNRPAPGVAAQFIGRNKEFDDYQKILAETGMVIITGMPGIGKSAFAYQLACRVAGDEHQVFWHEFDEKYNAYAFVLHMGRFLADHGYPDFWYRWDATKPPKFSADDALAELREQLQGKRCILCLDDFHLSITNAAGKLPKSFTNFLQEVNAQGIRVIITSEHQLDPIWFNSAQQLPLKGLTLQDSTSYLQMVAPHLVPVVDEIDQKIAGNATLLGLMVQAFAQMENNKELSEADLRAEIRALTGGPEYVAPELTILNSLCERIHRGLKNQYQRNVMKGIAIYRGRPVEKGAIDAAIGQQNSQAALNYLTKRNLILQDRDKGKRNSKLVYNQHSLVRTYYYQTVIQSQKEREKLHRLAAQYLETVDEDYLEAIIHYEQAKEPDHLLSLVLQHTTLIIQQGNAATLLAIVQRCLSTWNPAQQAAIALQISQGLLHDALDEFDRAERCFADALAAADHLPDTDERRLLQARAYHAWGKAQELQSPQKSAEAMKEAIALLTQEPRLVTTEAKTDLATTYVDLGNVYIYLGNYTGADRAIKNGIELLSEEATQIHSIAYRARNTIHLNLGKLAEAQAAVECAQAINEQLGAQYETATMWVNQGAIQLTHGDWPTAIDSLGKALTLAKQLQSAEIQTAATLNLGAIYAKRGNDALALEMLQESQTLAEKYRFHVMAIFIYFTLADLYVQIGQLEEAIEKLQAAEAKSIELNHRSSKTVIFSIQAEVALAKHQITQAKQHAQNAIAEAKATGEVHDAGIGHRLLGRCYIAEQNLPAAMEALHKSYDLLIGIDRYETARTTVHLGLAYREENNVTESKERFDAAEQTFRQLGAHRDLAHLAAIRAHETA